MVITIIIILSKTAGFAREMVFANYFGTSLYSDAYTNANTIVNMFILLFSACISSTFIPAYTKTLHDRGPLAANEYTNSMLGIFVLLGAGISALGYFFSPQMCELFMPQLIPDAAAGSQELLLQQENLRLTAEMARIMFPTMGFAAVTGVFTSLLNANERFVPEQLIGFALSFCVIGACVFFRSADAEQSIIAVSAATALTYVLQLIIVVPFLRGIYKFRPGIHSCEGTVKRSFILALPALLSMALDEINHLVDKNVGISLGIGVNTALNYSYRLITLVLGVMVVPLTTIMFSRLSKFAAGDEKKKILDATKQSLLVLSIVLVPVIVLAAVQSDDVIHLLYFRGAFDETSLHLTSTAFLFYVVGVLGFAWRNFLTRVFYAVQDTSAPMKIGVVSVAVNILLDIWLAKVMGVGGLTLATSISGMVGAMLMLIRLRRKVGRMGFRDTLFQLGKLTIAGGAAGLCAWYLAGFMAGSGVFLRLLCATAAGLMVYVALVLLLRVKGVSSLAHAVRRRTK